ncbi:MAG: ATP-binding protein, partial [Glaciecola sp.]
VVHDLKNVLAQIDLILCNAQQHKNNPEFIDDTFETLEHTKSRMDKMLSQLSEKQPTESTNNGSHLLSEIVAEVMHARCANLLPAPRLTVESEKPVVVDPEKFANVMYHLISNAQQATADGGYVELNLAHAPAMHLQTLVIKDNGEGMSEPFIRERLFKPFETTKGNAGMGIGAYDARNYLESIGGSLTVESAVGSGTVFTLSVPTN